MSDVTPRFGLPLLLSGQAQKEPLHNEAILVLEAMAEGLAEEDARNDPPLSPEPGQLWIIGDAPTGAWAARAGALALWTEGGWRFMSPQEGLAVRVKGSGITRVRGPAGWNDGEAVATSVVISGEKVVGARLPAIADPSGGSAIDGEARAAIGAILVALRTHGLIGS